MKGRERKREGKWKLTHKLVFKNVAWELFLECASTVKKNLTETWNTNKNKNFVDKQNKKRGRFATHSKFNEDLPSHGDPDNHSAQFEHNKIKLTSGWWWKSLPKAAPSRASAHTGAQPPVPREMIQIIIRNIRIIQKIIRIIKIIQIIIRIIQIIRSESLK